ALRLNRTLLWLSLAYNRIGDGGATKLAEVLAPFALTHEEVVERRVLLLETQGRQKSPPSARRPDSKSERSTSQLGSSTNIEKSKTGRVTSKKRKELGIPDKFISQTQLSLKKEEVRMMRRGSVALDARGSKTKLHRSVKEKRAVTQEQEAAEVLNPLIDFVEHRDGKVYLPGNLCLMSLNLTHNQITETGLKAFLTTVKTQTHNVKQSPDGRTTSGLLRLLITKNAFDLTCETYTLLQELMLVRDPVAKHQVVCSPTSLQNEQQ
ncbi:leucine-rich repeat-containing protein 71-like, partial [Cetorhinus maximus]